MNTSKIYVRKHKWNAICKQRRSSGAYVITAGTEPLGVGETPREAWDRAADHVRTIMFAKVLTQ